MTTTELPVVAFAQVPFANVRAPRMHPVDLNIDLGELADEPAALYALATVANVACGGHAGDRRSMARAVSFAMARGTKVAAHPSYPDRDGFGRTSLKLPADQLASAVEQQCAALGAIALRLGYPVSSMKPHGALYHDASVDPDIARAVIVASARGLQIAPEALTVIGPPSGSLFDQARALHTAYAREGFADRGYRSDGTLIPRGEPGALLANPEQAARQALSLARTAPSTRCAFTATPRAP